MSLLGWAVALGFVAGLIQRAIERRTDKRRAARRAAAPALSIAEAGIQRQTARLAAELDDDAAVDAWLAGGAR